MGKGRIMDERVTSTSGRTEGSARAWRMLRPLLLGRPLRRAAEDDRIVAVIDRFDPDHRLRHIGSKRSARVISGPFAERAFGAGLDLGRGHEALEHDLRVGRERDAGRLAGDELDGPAEPAAAGQPPYRVFNIGNQNPVQLMDFIGCIERSLGQKAEYQMLPMQDGDVPATFADVEALKQWVGFQPSTPIEQGVQRFVEWYRGYHGV